MINVNQITSELAKMPDAALKQYATMHKNDPYTMSLAMSESNRRKQIRDSAQGQGGQQPTVVDQELSQMDAPQQMPQGQAMPENTGIGTLPQQPLSMAEGGIVAFKDEGAVVDPEMSVWERLMERNRQYRESLPGTFGITGVRRGSQSGLPPSLQPTGMSAYSDVANAQNEAALAGLAGTAPNLGADMSAYSPAPGAVQVPLRAPSVSPLASIAGAPRTTAPTATPVDFATQYKATRGALKDTDPYADETRALGELGVTAAQERKAATEADIAKFDKAYEGREGRLAKREEDIGKQKDTNTGLALLNAGLAIMSTPGGLATAIGKGARVGTEQFAAGLDKIKAAQDRLDDARDKMDDLKLNRAEMSAKEIRQANSEINTARMEAKKLSLSGLKDAGAKNETAAGKIFEASTTAALSATQQAGALERAKIAAAPGLERNKMLAASQSDQAKIRTAYGALQAKVSAELAKDPAFTMEQNSAKKSMIRNARLREELLNNPFLSQYAGGIGFGGSASGTVRELDED